MMFPWHRHCPQNCPACRVRKPSPKSDALPPPPPHDTSAPASAVSAATTRNPGTKMLLSALLLLHAPPRRPPPPHVLGVIPLPIQTASPPLLSLLPTQPTCISGPRTRSSLVPEPGLGVLIQLPPLLPPCQPHLLVRPRPAGAPSLVRWVRGAIRRGGQHGLQTFEEVLIRTPYNPDDTASKPQCPLAQQVNSPPGRGSGPPPNLNPRNSPPLAPDQAPPGMGHQRSPAPSTSMAPRCRERGRPRQELRHGGRKRCRETVRGVHPQEGRHREQRTAGANATPPQPPGNSTSGPPVKGQCPN